MSKLGQVRFSDLSVKLHDDAEEASSLLRRVLELYVYSTELTAKVATGVDYRGKSSANVQVVGAVQRDIVTTMDLDV